METELIAAAQAGDTGAFSLLVRRYSRRIYRLAHSFVHNVDDASDVAQEVFLRAYRNITRFDTTRAIYPWLHRITRNISINLRSRKANTEGSLPPEDLIPASEADPLTATVRNEEADDLRAAIARLPPIHREIIQLKHFQECSYRTRRI